MYTWNIEKLNAQLISGEMTESDTFKYLMANTILYLLASIQFSNVNQYDTLNGSIGIFIDVLGLLFIYKCNGGKHGKRIIERYLSISWVIFVRFCFILLIPSTIAIFTINEVFMEGVAEETTLMDVVFTSSFEIIYMLWIAKHIKYVAKQAG